MENTEKCTKNLDCAEAMNDLFQRIVQDLVAADANKANANIAPSGDLEQFHATYARELGGDAKKALQAAQRFMTANICKTCPIFTE